jgi:hypothetical protein
MTIRKPLLALAFGVSAALAACEQAPTASPDDAGVRANVLPYAVITVDSIRPDGYSYRYYLNGTGSYDPDGLSVTYDWTTTCPDHFASQYSSTFFAQNGQYAGLGATCRVTLKVTDANGATRSTAIFVENSPPQIE